MSKLLRVRATGLKGGKSGPLGHDLRVEVIGPSGEVVGLLSCLSAVITCDGRKERVTAKLEVAVAEVDVIANEA